MFFSQLHPLKIRFGSLSSITERWNESALRVQGRGPKIHIYSEPSFRNYDSKFWKVFKKISDIKNFRNSDPDKKVSEISAL